MFVCVLIKVLRKKITRPEFKNCDQIIMLMSCSASFCRILKENTLIYYKNPKYCNITLSRKHECILLTKLAS